MVESFVIVAMLCCGPDGLLQRWPQPDQKPVDWETCRAEADRLNKRLREEHAQGFVTCRSAPHE
jgi:hypothetical protein